MNLSSNFGWSFLAIYALFPPKTAFFWESIDLTGILHLSRFTLVPT
jgi:hypothetical protein